MDYTDDTDGAKPEPEHSTFNIEHSNNVGTEGRVHPLMTRRGANGVRTQFNLVRGTIGRGMKARA
jgi:hypothetical protein